MAVRSAVKSSSLIKKFISENAANSAESKFFENTTMPSKECYVEKRGNVNSKRIGNIGEAKVLSKFVELGIPVYLPFGDNEKADLVADFNGKLNKIQVKTSLKAENGVVKFDLVSSTLHRKNGVKHIYNKTEIDYFACYNITRDKIYLIDLDNFNQSSIQIRYETPLNSQMKKIRYENDYLLENILCVETLHGEPKLISEHG